MCQLDHVLEIAVASAAMDAFDLQQQLAAADVAVQEQ
jgi:hypothetical protein